MESTMNWYALNCRAMLGTVLTLQSVLMLRYIKCIFILCVCFEFKKESTKRKKQKRKERKNKDLSVCGCECVRVCIAFVSMRTHRMREFVQIKMVFRFNFNIVWAITEWETSEWLNFLLFVDLCLINFPARLRALSLCHSPVALSSISHSILTFSTHLSFTHTPNS